MGTTCRLLPTPDDPGTSGQPPRGASPTDPQDIGDRLGWHCSETQWIVAGLTRAFCRIFLFGSESGRTAGFRGGPEAPEMCFGSRRAKPHHAEGCAIPLTISRRSPQPGPVAIKSRSITVQSSDTESPQIRQPVGEKRVKPEDGQEQRADRRAYLSIALPPAPPDRQDRDAAAGRRRAPIGTHSGREHRGSQAR